jgi:hypothetical protein
MLQYIILNRNKALHLVAAAEAQHMKTGIEQGELDEAIMMGHDCSCNEPYLSSTLC